MHQVKQLQAVALLACAVTVVEAFALLSRPVGLRSFRNVGVQMAAPTQDKMQITPARISDIANDLKSKHTPAIAKEIDALFAPLTRELPPTKVKLDACLPSDLPGLLTHEFLCRFVLVFLFSRVCSLGSVFLSLLFFLLLSLCSFRFDLFVCFGCFWLL